MNAGSRDGAVAEYRCGYITLIGRPNVGKSTLLNRLLGQKISITSRRPQTTRWQLLGVATGPRHQALYIDTPGIQTRYGSALNRHMLREAVETLERVDLVLFVIEALKWTPGDRHVAALLGKADVPILMVINKIDKLGDKKELLPFMQRLSADADDYEMIPVSARTGENLDRLKNRVIERLPVNPPVYPDDAITDRNQRFLAAEFIREKLTRKLGGELPYQLTVTIDEFVEEENIIRINAIIWITARSQKAIVIGKDGAVLKAVGEQARAEMEELFGKKVYLNTWVKVKRKWTEDESALRQLGYTGGSTGERG
jgi:GTP-binding protein Era